MSYVYAVELPNGLIKFGYSRYLKKRFRSLKREYGAIKPRGVAAGFVAQERDLHRLLNADRVNGEMFRPSAAVERVISLMSDWPEEATQESRPYTRRFWPCGSPNLTGAA